MREHFDQPMNAEALAELLYLSPSSFHHFQAVTNMSPLQFQKASRLTPTANLDVMPVSQQAGYTSASQFLREYGRLFGRAPAQGLAMLREQGQVPAALN